MNLHYVTAHRKGVDTKSRTVTAWASTQALDRDNEVILAEAWQHPDSTREFELSPVGIVAHNYKTLPVFKVIRLDKSPRGLKFTAQFYDTPTSRETFEFIAQSGLASFSVGFNAVSWRDMTLQEVNQLGVDVSGATGSRVRVYDHVKLLEISLVALPANIEATAVGAAYESGLVRTPELAVALKSLRPAPRREVSEAEARAVVAGLRSYLKSSGFRQIISETIQTEVKRAFDRAQRKAN